MILTYNILYDKKSACFKWTYGFSGDDYSVAALSKLKLTAIKIIVQSFKSLGQF